MKAIFFGEHFCSANQVDVNEEIKVEMVNARSLISSDRIDLIPKIRFVEDVISGNYRKNTINDYKKSIDAFSNGTFKEPGNLDKNSFQAYIDTFLKLIESIKLNGFKSDLSIIPVGDNNVILDGAHRLSIAIVLDRKVAISKFERLTKKYDVEYFLKRSVDRITAESWVQDYLQRTNKHATFILWPKLNKIQRAVALEIINENSKNVVYERSDTYHKAALHQITAIAYDGHPWVGSHSNRFSGCLSKAKEISGSTNIVTSITVEMEHDLVEKVKLNIRKELAVGNAGIHSSDNYEESRYLAHHFYNNNTRNVLKRGGAFKYASFLKKLFIFRSLVKENKFSLNDFVIVSSSVLGLYGLRNPNDIDFLSCEKSMMKIENSFIENHHHVLNYYNLSINDYLWDSRNYIYFFGVKIYSIEEMVASNKNRVENTKYTDIKLAKLDVRKQNIHIHWLRVLGFNQRAVRVIRLSFVQVFVYLAKWFPIIKTIYRKYLK